MKQLRYLLVRTPNDGIPKRAPLVIAIAAGHLVKFNRRDGWTCNCDTEGDECQHVDAVADQLDPRVFDDREVSC